MTNHYSTVSAVAQLHAGRQGKPALYKTVLKRVLDIALSILLLPILLPVLAVLCVLVMRDGGPGLFGHARVGRNGKVFKCWKVRTMVTDAQARLDALLESDPQAREEWDRDRKLRNDPRITRLGAFLRQSSLDELPQIFNVLKGEMSLVGPRPVTAPELDRYGGGKSAYLALRPGVTACGRSPAAMTSAMLNG